MVCSLWCCSGLNRDQGSKSSQPPSQLTPDPFFLVATVTFKPQLWAERCSKWVSRPPLAAIPLDKIHHALWPEQLAPALGFGEACQEWHWIMHTVYIWSALRYISALNPLFFHTQLLLPEAAQLKPSDSSLNAVFITFFPLDKRLPSPQAGSGSPWSWTCPWSGSTSQWKPPFPVFMPRFPWTAALPGAFLAKGNEFPPGCHFSAELPFGKLQ